MALNPIVFTEKVVRSFLRYQLTAYPFATKTFTSRFPKSVFQEYFQMTAL